MNAWTAGIGMLQVATTVTSKPKPKKKVTGGSNYVKVDHAPVQCVICGDTFKPRCERSRYCGDPVCIRKAATIAKRAERARHAST